MALGKHVQKQSTHTDIGDLMFGECDQASVISAATRDPRGGVHSHVQIKPPHNDPDLSKAVASSLVAQFYKLISGVCCNMEGNYANQMVNKKITIVE